MAGADVQDLVNRQTVLGDIIELRPDFSTHTGQCFFLRACFAANVKDTTLTYWTFWSL